MESLGDKLREARESKSLTLKQVSSDTNIVPRYLEALEKEDFSKFPGESYVLGFLRTYGDYLGLDQDELAQLYRAFKIQEQPIPIAALTSDPKTFPRWLAGFLIAIPVLAFLGASVYFIFVRPRLKAAADAPVRIPEEYILEGGKLERHFYPGDSVLVKLGDDSYKIEMRDMAEPFTVFFPAGKAELPLGADTGIDLNSDGFDDIKAVLLEYNRKKPEAGALVLLETGASTADNVLAGPTPEYSTATTEIFPSSAYSYPFIVQARFQGYCMFRWEIDRKERNERYFSRGDEINPQARDRMRLWVSNAAAVQISIIGAGKTMQLKLGEPGEVAVADLHWIPEGDRLRLVMDKLE